MPPTVGEKPRRSRTGCQNCRRLHRKCDETKPACLECLGSGKQCVYGLRLSWGGRPFAKSSFGRCLQTAVAVVPVSEPSCDIGEAGQSRHMTGLNTEENETGILNAPFIYGLANTRHGIAIEVAESESQNSFPSSWVSSRSPLQAYSALKMDANPISQNPSPLSRLPPAHRLLLDHFCHSVT